MTELTGAWMLILMLVVGAAGCTLLLRWAGMPARGGSNHSLSLPLLGGLMAGALLGPAILGRVVPDQYESWFTGGAVQRRALTEIVRRQGADRLAAEHAHLEADQMRALAAHHAQERTVAQQVWRDAHWSHQAALRHFSIACAGILLLFSGAFAVQPIFSRRAVAGAVSIGFWSAVLPGTIAFTLACAWWGCSLNQALVLAGAASIGPWAFTTIDSEAADRAELNGAAIMQLAGRVASGLSLCAIVYSLMSTFGAQGLSYATAALTLPIGWVLRKPLQRWRSLLDSVLQFVLVPFIAAALIVKVDLHEQFQLWPLLIVALLSCDGRWVGALLGAIVLARPRANSLRLILPAMAAGRTQLAVAMIAAQTGTIPEALLLPLAIGAALIELSAPSRKFLLNQLAFARQRNVARD